ncbi:(R)-mandelonitrile lyase [Miltoncostaea oceani]|jgi:quercetin dioxygenase-like cupin family protein|uniref:(R)-mandelonitrile lyase n=1 Tax=Miltoncostaea oceani TaxID=2843216 RepID=UPI001C3E4F9A|nr:cupin domain-containing protein [Miltoncostaea oceani]
MRITRVRPDTKTPSADWFTGDVWVDDIATPPPPAAVRVVSVHFAPGARTAWHTHPLGQVLHVTEGQGLVQRRGAPPEVVRAGDTVEFAPGEDHWHGAGPSSFMTHLAVHEADAGGSHVTWGAHVTDAEYAEAPAPA